MFSVNKLYEFFFTFIIMSSVISGIVKVKVKNKQGNNVKVLKFKPRSKSSPYYKDTKKKVKELEPYIKSKEYEVLVKDYMQDKYGRVLPSWVKIKNISQLEDLVLH